MKTLGAYMMLLGWLSCMSFSWLVKPDPFIISSKGGHVCHSENTSHSTENTKDCCSKFNSSKKIKSEKSHCDNHSHESNNCCKSQNCSRTCCNVYVWNVTEQESIDFSIFPLPTPFGLALKKQLCKPYLGIISPPPNFS